MAEDRTTSERGLRFFVRIHGLTAHQLRELIWRRAWVAVYDVPCVLTGVRADGLLTVEPMR